MKIQWNKSVYQDMINGFYNIGKSEEWLKGYISCINFDRKITLMEWDKLTTYIENIFKKEVKK